MNILIDTLRQESTKEKMDKCLDNIQKLLNSLEDVYTNQCSQECNVVKKYKIYLDMEIDVLIAEIKRFLEAYPPDFNKDPKIQRRRASQTSEKEDPTEGLIPNQMIYCKFQVDAISNWQFGVWEAINQYINVAKQELLVDADEWIKHRTAIIEKRLGLRLLFHRLRFLRIKENIYTQRLDELCCHDRRIDEHRIGIETSLKTIRNDTLSSEETYQKILEMYFQGVERIQRKLKDFQNSSLAKANLHVLKAMFTKASEKFDEVHAENMKKIEDLMNKVKVSNIKYVEAMKIFTEGGNFSIPETKVYSKQLNKFQATCEKTLSGLTKEVNVLRQKYQETLAKRNGEIVASMHLVRDELLFIENQSVKIKNLENDLKLEVCAAKTTCDNLKNQFDNLILQQTTLYCGSYEFLHYFNQEFQGYNRQIAEFAEFLLHPAPLLLYTVLPSIPNTSENIVETMELQDQSKSEGKPNHHVAKNKKEEVPINVDYTAKIFCFHPNLEENVFLSKSTAILWKHWKDMYQAAKIRAIALELKWKAYRIYNKEKREGLKKKYQKCIGSK